jgi:hypothetical protein
MKAATEAKAETLREKNLNLTNINHYIYVASKVIVEEINEKELYTPTQYHTTRPWVTRKLLNTNDVRRGLPASSRNKKI